MNQIINKEIPRNILLNPGPATTSEKVKSSLVVADICPREAEFGELLGNVRRNLLKVVNANAADYESVLIGGSGTAAIESALSRICDTNDEILILENGAYGERMGKICKALGIKSDSLKFQVQSPIDTTILRSHLKANLGRYRAVAFVHHETTTGLLNSLEAIHDICTEFKLVSLVDAMSSFAGIPIDLTATSVDYLVSSSNKCIQGMAGIGIVIVKKIEAQLIASHEIRSFYLDLYNNLVSQKEKNQFAFTPPVQILYALDAAVEEFLNEGMSKRFDRYSELYQFMLDGMLDLGLKLFISKENHSKILTTFYAPNDARYNFNKMHDYLYSKGITIYPGKVLSEDTFRISNIGDLNKEDISYFLNSIKDYLTHSQIQP